MKHEMPSSVRAASATIPARSPLVTHIFVPLITYSSPSRVARHDEVARVAPGVGLRQREAAAELARREARQPALLLLLGAVVHDEVRGDRVRVDDARQRHPSVRELFDDADVREQVEAEPAVLLGDRDAEQPERLHLLDDRFGIAVGVLELRRDRDHLACDEAAHGRRRARGGLRDRSRRCCWPCAHAIQA